MNINNQSRTGKNIWPAINKYFEEELNAKECVMIEMQSSMKKLEQRVEQLEEMVDANQASESLNTLVPSGTILEVARSDNSYHIVGKLLTEPADISFHEEDMYIWGYKDFKETRAETGQTEHQFQYNSSRNEDPDHDRLVEERSFSFSWPSL